MSSRPQKAVAQNGVGQKKNGTTKSTNHHNKNNNNKNNNNNNNNTNSRQQLCRYFAQGGNCHFGDTCKFIHAASNNTSNPSSNKSSNDTIQSSTPASSNTPPVKTWASLAAGKSSTTNAAAAPSNSSTAPPSNPSTTKPSNTPAATTPSNPLPTPTPAPATTPAAPATTAAKPSTDAPATTTPSAEVKKDASSEKKETDPTPSTTPSPAPATTPATTSSTVVPTATPSPPPAAPKPKPSSWAALVKPHNSSNANTTTTPIEPAATNHTGEEKPKRQKKNKVKKEKPAPVVDAAALEAESGEGWTKVSSKKEEKKSAPIQNGKYNKPAKNGKFSSPFGSPLCHHFLEGKCRFTDTCSLSHTFPAVDDQSNTDINDRLIKYGAAVIGPSSIIDPWVQSANQSLDALRHAISGADERLEVDQVVAIPLAAAIEAYKNGRLVAYLTSSAADNGAGLNLSESYRRASFVLGAVDPKSHVSTGRLERVLKLINDNAATDASWASVAVSPSTKIISIIETPLFASEELGVGASITFNVPSGKPESGDKAIDSVLRELFEEAMIDFGSAAELSAVTVQNKLWASTPVPRNKLLHVRFIVIDPSKFDASTISTTTIKKDRSVIPHWTSKAPALRSLLTDAERKLRSTSLKNCLIKEKPIAVKDAAHIKIVWNNAAAASSASKSVNHSNAAPSKPTTPSTVASASNEKKSWGNKK